MNLNTIGNPETKIKVGAVSYLNTKPLVFGFEKGMMNETVELLYDYPGRIAELLLANKIDIGLVPVAIIPQMKEYHIVSDFCIAADGPVASVCLLSNVPLPQVTTVLLDYQSRTSVILAKYLLKQYWKLDVQYKNAGADFLNEINGHTAAVVIGDRALSQRKVLPYCYDLAEAWKEHTGLPFVFAAWISNKPLTATFVAAFNDANAYGLKHIAEVIQANPYSLFDLEKYYTQNIRYQFGKNEQDGLQHFLHCCRQLQQSSEHNLVAQ